MRPSSTAELLKQLNFTLEVKGEEIRLLIPPDREKQDVISAVALILQGELGVTSGPSYTVHKDGSLLITFFSHQLAAMGQRQALVTRYLDRAKGLGVSEIKLVPEQAEIQATFPTSMIRPGNIRAGIYLGAAITLLLGELEGVSVRPGRDGDQIAAFSLETVIAAGEAGVILVQLEEALKG
jgi:hypothetical protein